MNHLNKKAYPISDHYIYYEEEDLFTVIEILFDHICYYDYNKEEFIRNEPKNEFATHINNLLKRYTIGVMVYRGV